MTPTQIVATLFWSMLLTALVALLFDRLLWRVLRQHWKPLLIVLLATGLWRVPVGGIFFHGLEYEDSYVYTVAGRQMVEHVGPEPQNLEMPFSISVCEIGSLENCQRWEPFAEHLIGYPYVIGLVSGLLGYKPSVGSLINLVTSLVSAWLTFLLVMTLLSSPRAALLAGLSYATIPVFAVYGLETSAEPFSSFCLLLALYSFTRLCDESSSNKALNWLAYTCALLFAQTVKREDLLLALLLPMLLFLMRPGQNEQASKPRLLFGMIFLSSALTIGLDIKMHLFQTSKNEQELLRQFPLTIARLVHFVGSFLSSFLVTRWYGGSVLVVAVGFVFAIRAGKRALVPVVILVLYVLLYAVHIRSYYEMESGQLSPESAVRFSMNLMGLWAIAAGMGLDSVVLWVEGIQAFLRHRRLVERALVGILVGLLCNSFFATWYLRRDLVEDEMISRINPGSVAAHSARDDEMRPAFILTMDPLVVQMYARADTRVIDLESVDVNTLVDLVKNNSALTLLVQTSRFSDVDIERYGEAIRFALSLPSHQLAAGDGFKVLSLENDVIPEH